jgi:hypothetical protein
MTRFLSFFVLIHSISGFQARAQSLEIAEGPLRAEVPAESFVDPHPYQSQSFFRLGESSLDAGMIQIVLPKPVPEYRFWLAGNPEQQLRQNALLMHEKRNPLPATEFAGSNYVFTRGGYLSTLTADGFLKYKGKVGFRPEVSGGVWFVAQGSRDLYAIDSFGFFINTGLKVGAVRVIGGNYLNDSQGTLITIKASGAGVGSPIGIATRKDGWNFSNVVAAGGNYFLKGDGTLVTVDSQTGIFNEVGPAESKPLFRGGNYFVGEDGLLYSVSYDGKVRKNPEVRVSGNPIVIGYSVIKLEDGLIAAVDVEGKVHRNLIRVSTTGVRVSVVNTLDVDLDPASFFVPRILN